MIENTDNYMKFGSIESIEKERIIFSTTFAKGGLDFSSPSDKSNMVGYQYSLELTLRKDEVDSLNAFFTRYGVNRPFIWDGAGYSTQSNTYQFIGVLVTSQKAIALGENMVDSNVVIELRDWTGGTEVTTVLATTAYSLTNDHQGIVEFSSATLGPSRYVYAAYKRLNLVSFADPALMFEPVRKGFYRTSFKLREVNS